MKVGRLIVRATACALGCSVAFAQVLGSTNLGFGGYPDPSCHTPHQPYAEASESAWRSFKTDVEIYIDCVNEYVEAADNDAKRIHQSQDDALSEAKRFLPSIR